MSGSRNGDELVAVGRITGVHGIRGEVKVESLTDFPERFDAGGRLLLVSPAGKTGQVKILQSRFHKDRYLLLLDGVADRNAAEELRGSYLKIDEDDIKELPEGRYYHHELTGLAVVTEVGEKLGKVTGIVQTGSNMILEVRGGGREVLIPFIDDVILNVDLDGGTITIHPMPGLLPDE